jgi:hypothetical protein
VVKLIYRTNNQSKCGGKEFGENRNIFCDRKKEIWECNLECSHSQSRFPSSKVKFCRASFFCKFDRDVTSGYVAVFAKIYEILTIQRLLRQNFI